MKAELITVGNEIALGQIANTNGQFLADALTRYDITAPYQVTVADDPELISSAVKAAHARCQLVCVLGGLGPTDDDKTLAATAKGLGVGITIDQQYWNQLSQELTRQGRPIAPEVKREAAILAGATPLSNPRGEALGSWYSDDQGVVAVLPGPPVELKAMVTAELLPKIAQKFGNGTAIASRMMHFLGRPEAVLMDEIKKATADQSGLAITSYVQPGEIQVRLTIHHATAAEAQSRLDACEKEIIKKEEQYYFGTGEDVSLASAVVHRLNQRGLTITAAESLTGGLCQATICSVPGASNVFNGGFVTYAPKLKEKLVGVPDQTIADYGVVSSQVAAAMAEGSASHAGADVGLGFTGVAGPDALEGHPAGTVWLGMSFPGQATKTKLLKLPSNASRQWIRTRAVQFGLQMVYQALQK